MYHVKLNGKKFEPKCPLHPRFDPEKKSKGAIVGVRIGCRCWQLCDLHLRVHSLERELRGFNDAPAMRDNTLTVERMTA